MKRFLKSILLSFLLVFSLTRCSEKIGSSWHKCEHLSKNMDTIKMYLPGHWEWVEDRVVNKYGPARVNTPKTLNYTIHITIDDEKIIIDRAFSRVKTYHYKIESEKSLTGYLSDNYPVLTLCDVRSGSRLNYFRIFICSNTLILSQSYRAHGFPDVTYKRVYKFS